VDRARSDFQQETKLIPWWSYVMAACVFVGMQFLFNQVLAPKDPHPRAYIAVWGVLCGMFMAFYMLMIGFVTRDSKRRGMNPIIWTLILVALLPSGVGFIVYFLLREPVTMKCPHCSAAISHEHNFCTQCSFQLKPICSSCHRALGDEDVYCAYCGTAAIASESRSVVRR
jgi:hypothetical protein